MNLKNIFTVLILTVASNYSFAQKYLVQPVPFSRVNISEGFWSARLAAHADATLDACIVQMQDSTERISNFEKAAGLKKGTHEGIYFDDSDVYKAMEGIAYSLINNPNPEYEDLLDRWIGLIEKAQQPDGYLNTFYTLGNPDERWTDMSKHEMYCGGHMIEAAVAHYQTTGKKIFLNVAIKFADHLAVTFGPEKRHWMPGHEEIELALVKLYHQTGEEKYLNLAHWLLEERGHGIGSTGINAKKNPEYWQDDVPVSEITDIKGHAVRAMYLFAGMADVATEKKIPGYVEALNRVWEDVVYKNMYITGGIGSSASNEGFTEDYDLPNKTAYCETCASIGMVFWNNRMNLLSGDAKFADVMERALYNGVLSGVSLKGDLFFYVNPLESDGDHHRQRWYGCACCPSNISRFIPSVGSYIYLEGENEIFVNLYVDNRASLRLGGTEIELLQKTNYPWDGKIRFEINPTDPVDCSLKLRIPGWCKKYSVKVNGETIGVSTNDRGYLTLSRKWSSGDKVVLDLDMPVELVASDARVKENIGKRAVQRGPLVYCIEQVDNKDNDWNKISVNDKMAFQLSKEKGVLKDMTTLKMKASGNNLKFIPYFVWDNREAGKMKVWIDYCE